MALLLAAGLGIAYHAKPNVRAQAKHKIDHADLRALLWAQEPRSTFRLGRLLLQVMSA